MMKIEISKYVSPLAVLLDKPEAYKAERFEEAKKYVGEGMELHVSSRGVWSGRFKEPRSVQSYERIGYHSGAEWLLEGFLLAGGKAFFHGFDGIEGEVSL